MITAFIVLAFSRHSGFDGPMILMILVIPALVIAIRYVSSDRSKNSFDVRFRREHRSHSLGRAFAKVKASWQQKESTKQNLAVRRERAARSDGYADVVAVLLWAFWFIPVGIPLGMLVGWAVGVPPVVSAFMLLGAYAALVVGVIVFKVVLRHREAPVICRRNDRRHHHHLRGR